jgi:hypothetical protein
MICAYQQNEEGQAYFRLSPESKDDYPAKAACRCQAMELPCPRLPGSEVVTVDTDQTSVSVPGLVTPSC